MPLRSALAALAMFTPAISLFAADPTPEQADFFEKRVRPVLVDHCYKCHSDAGKAPKGGLRVDGRGHLLVGGDGGPSLVPGKPDESKIIEAVRYANPDLLMPPKGKLPPAAIADLEAWVKAGAAWPNDAGVAKAAKSFDVQARAREHWSWKPVAVPPVPAVKDAAWPADPIDKFVLAKLEAKNLRPAGPADKAAWLRRVTFALTGLPPTPAELAVFQKGEPAAAVVDRLLASPAFGERWGRHWLDLVRYGESRGHEFDPDIPNVWRYRDYVVRAVNADVPYHRFVQEHVAGDVLPDPRLAADGSNETVQGTGFWHLGEEVHSPVDIRQDQADRLDNRIDVLTKAFFGLTVSCARCHDHKFDAISTKDFYALYGLLEGSSYRNVRIDGWNENRAVVAELAKLRESTSAKLAKDRPRPVPAVPSPAFQEWLKTAKVVVDYANPGPNGFLPDDVTFGPVPVPAGRIGFRPGKDGKPETHVEERAAAVFDPFWAGLKAKDSRNDFGDLGKLPRAGFSIRTPNFTLEKANLYYLVRGGGVAYAGVCGHTIIAGPLHGSLVTSFPDAAGYRWVGHALPGYMGQRVHVELTADPKTPFAVAMVVQADGPPPGFPAPDSKGSAAVPIPPELAAEVAAAEKALTAKVVWESRLALGLWDGGNPVAEQVFIRGNPRTPGETVPPRMLEALAPPDRPVRRLEFAQQITDPAKNPYVARVAVNRVWHHLFGRGLVPTPDNFGVLGEPPTHPELLDFLATEFVRDGWSTKRLIRRLVLSSSYGMSSNGPPVEADAANLLLHKFRLKRLEGEAIRDSILQITGRLDR
ncbi:MAG: PSD1 and planctomycete cytochrome C domain-containing protein, partial [Fimbriiglobus sp.]